MSLEAHLPLAAVVVLVVLSLSLDHQRSFFWNFVAVAAGVLLAWAIRPAGSPWATGVCVALSVLAVATSPLVPFGVGVVRGLLRWLSTPQGSKTDQTTSSTTGPENPGAINILHDPKHSKFDIVAVHGLGSSVETTWTHKKTQKLWLRDFLGCDFPEARIMTFRHNSRWGSGALVKDLPGYGKQLLSALEARRAADQAKDVRPIIFIGHSFGGLLIEQALVIAGRHVADRKVKSRHNELSSGLAGVIFLGTPHAGSTYSTLGRLYCLLRQWEGASPLLLGYLSPGSPETRQLEDEFLQAYPDKSFDFHETKPNMILGIPFKMIVTQSAATRPGQQSVPLDTDHFGLNKYESKEDASYNAVKDKITQMLDHWSEVKREQENHDIEFTEMGVLRSLEKKVCDFSTITEVRQSKLTPGTCEWITDEPEFHEWESEKRLLWIIGKPGSGKTYIAQWLCDHYQTTGGLMYFFFGGKGDKVNDLHSLEKFFPTILYQLLQWLRKTHTTQETRAKCFKEVDSIIHRENFGANRYREALAFVLSSTEEPDRLRYLIIDALDEHECGLGDDKGSDNVALGKWYEGIRDLPGLNIVITSRPLQPIQALYQGSDDITLQLDARVAKLDADIDKYIHGRIREQDSGFPAEMSAVVQTLKWKASGMILYARLALDILKETAATEDELLDRLDQMPESLAKLYAEQLEKVSNKEFAKTILQCLTTCRRPLTVNALRGIYAISKPGKKGRKSLRVLGQDREGRDRFRMFLDQDLLPLVEVLKNNTVRLVHATVAQFVLGEDLDGSKHRCPDDIAVDRVKGHRFLAMTCLAYLRWDFGNIDADEKIEVLDDEQLREYAVLMWDTHCEQSEKHIMAETHEKETVLSFFRHEAALEAWVERRAKLDSLFGFYFWPETVSTRPRPVHIAAYCDLSGLALLLLQETGVDIDVRDGAGSTALHIAARKGCLKTVEELVQRGARADVADDKGSYVLHWVAQRGRDEVLDFLLKSCQLDVDVLDDQQRTPLHVASFHGRPTCVEILLQQRASVDLVDEDLCTPLLLAVQRSHLEIVQQLVEHGADVNLANYTKRTPLAHAVCDEKMVDRLLKAKADASIPDCEGETPLFKSVSYGGADEVRMLLERSAADPNVPNGSLGDSALLHAAWRKNCDKVDILFRHGAEPDTRNRFQDTALHRAVNKLFKIEDQAAADALIKLLVDRGVPVAAHNIDGDTALDSAVRLGNLGAIEGLLAAGAVVDHAVFEVPATLGPDRQKTIKHLLDKMSSLDVLDHYGNTPLHIAAALGDESLAATLTDAAAPTTCYNLQGKTPLMEAEARGHARIAELLQSAGARPEPRVARERWGRNVLHWAAEECSSWEGQLCDDSNGSLVNAQDDMGRTPLHLAVLSRNRDLFQQLLAAHADVSLPDKLGRRPLHFAASIGDEAMIRALLGAKADVISARDARGETPAQLAAQMGNVTAMETLIAAGDTLEPSGEGQSLLHLAARSGDIRLCRLLLQGPRGRGFLSAQDCNGQTVLHVAASRSRSGEFLEEILGHALKPTFLNKRDRLGRTALFWAVDTGSLGAAKSIIEAGAALYLTNIEGFTAIDRAVSEGHVQLVEAMLDALPGQVAARLAEWDTAWPPTRSEDDGETGIHKVLVDIGAAAKDPATGMLTKDATKWAAASRQWLQSSVVEGLRSGVRPGAGDISTALKEAVLSESEDMARLVLDRMPETRLEGKDELRQTALELASARGLTDTARRLVEAGAAVDSTRPRPWETSSLFHAVSGGHVELVKLLLGRGAGTQMTDPADGATLLHLAAMRGAEAVVRQLVPAICVNAADWHGLTALHLAGLYGHGAVVDVLVDAGAHVYASAFFTGRTPLEMARGRVRTETLVRMRERAVDRDRGREVAG